MKTIVESMFNMRVFRCDSEDWKFINSVFNDEYHIVQIAERGHVVRSVLDIGAHAGSFTALCGKYWPNAKYYCVEPHPINFEFLKENIAHLNATLINKAVGYRNQRAFLCSPVSNSTEAFYVGDLWEHASTPRPNHFGIVTETIDVETLIGLCDTQTFDIVKIDCEGGEYTFFQQASDLGIMNRFGWIRGEWHDKTQNANLGQCLSRTHDYNIDPNEPHLNGLFVAHRKS